MHRARVRHSRVRGAAAAAAMRRAGDCCCYSCSRSESPFAGEIRVGLGWVRSSQHVLRKISKKKSVIPPLPLFRNDRHGYGGRHTKPATPPLFGGIFLKTRDAIPP